MKWSKVEQRDYICHGADFDSLSDSWTTKWHGPARAQKAIRRLKAFSLCIQHHVFGNSGLYYRSQGVGMLNLILTKACSLLEKEDTEQIRSMIRSLLNDDGPRGRLKRHGKLTTLLEKDFKELHVINLEGLIQFRLHAYKKELEEIVDYAMEEFWADRQYEEFMGLLKYFVFFQESKVPLVHVLHQGGHNFTILDSAMVPIPTPDADDIIVEMPGIELEMEVEDRIVSTLISISPASIILHTDDEHTPIVRTLLHIFEDKVKLSRLYPGQDVQK
uniref:Sporulation protein YtxC n=1 Tax=Paenibacillus polymyxa TaxID=1406 RepID=A0AAE9L9Z9_PAEPO